MQAASGSTDSFQCFGFEIAGDTRAYRELKISKIAVIQKVYEPR